MSDFFKKNTDPDGFDWGSPGGATFHKWTHVGQVLEGEVTKRGFHQFSDGEDPVRQLHIETATGEVILTVSQVDLRSKMASANVNVNDNIKVTYLGEERAAKGMKKVFALEMLPKTVNSAA